MGGVHQLEFVSELVTLALVASSAILVAELKTAGFEDMSVAQCVEQRLMDP